MARDKIDIPDIKRRPITVPVRCGDCAFHKRLAVLGRPCYELGTPPSAEVCHRFVPDPKSFGDGEKFIKVFRVIAAVPKKSLAAAALLGARRAQKLGYAVGTKVAFRVMGDDYLNNYATGIVVGATRDQVVVAGAENFTALLYPSALLDKEAWEAKRGKLVRTNKVNDPKGLKPIKVKDQTKLLVYVPELVTGKKAKRKKAKEPEKTVKVRRGVTKGGKTITISGG